MRGDRFSPPAAPRGAMGRTVSPELRSAHALEHIAARLDDLVLALEPQVVIRAAAMPGDEHRVEALLETARESDRPGPP